MEFYYSSAWATFDGLKVYNFSEVVVGALCADDVSELCLGIELLPSIEIVSLKVIFVEHFAKKLMVVGVAEGVGR